MFNNLYAMIENTTICGASCIMCPRDKFFHQFGNMSFETFKKIINELIEGGCRKIGITGFGDSLCDNQLEKKLEYTKTVCSDMLITTINTGHLFTDRNIELINKYIDIIKLSMYGFTKANYEKVHKGSLKFEKTKDNIDRFLEVKKPYTIMTFLLMPENENDMASWRYYYEPKCDRIDVWKPHNWAGATANSNKITHACKRAIDCSDLQFCADGSLVLCCFDFNRNNIIGNINDMTIAEMLNGEVLHKIQDIHRSGKILQSNLICKYCDQIRDRGDALIYCSDIKLQVGKSSMIDYSGKENKR